MRIFVRIKYNKLILYFLFIELFIFIGCENKKLTSQNDEIGLENYESTYDVIQGEIFDQYCISCHISGNSAAEASELILTSDTSYASLVNQHPHNFFAYNDGLLRVSTASENASSAHEGLGNSFLIEKIDALNIDHLNNEHPNYGGIMPPNFLTNGQIDFIKEWVRQGAPESGHVAELTLLDNIEKFDPEFIPLDIPDNGVQIHLGPFDVMPQQETEFFYYYSLNNPMDVFIKRVEIEMRTGSHHFILYIYPENFPINIEEGVQRHLRHEDGSYNESVLSIMPYQIFLTGTQWTELDVSFPDNVGLRLPANTYFDLNPHYLNYTDELIIGEIYTNLHYMDSEPEYIAEILQLNVIEELFLPPGDTTSIEKVFMFEDVLSAHNLDYENVNSIDIFQLFSHAHEKMLTFEVFFIDDDNNTEDVQLYYCNDWEHPPINYYGASYSEESIQIFQGEGLRLKATYYNWTDTALEFGFLSTDEMMILFGYFYTQ